MYKILMRLKGINAYLIVFVFLHITSCTGTTKITDDQLLIQLKKTPCYGTCPVYTIKIDQKGNGIFNGFENTDYTGLYSFRLNNKQLEGLITSFEQSGFFEMEDKYHGYVSDLPTIYLTYQSDGKKKKIMDYYGAPPELKDLEKQIETLVLSRKMKKIN